MSNQQIIERLKELEQILEQYKSERLSLDITRGKPSSEQLDLALPMLNCITENNFRTADNTDARNYGVLDGILEMKSFFAEVLGVTNTEVFVGGNSSLTLMHDLVGFAYVHGFLDSDKPWSEQKVKFLCPVPGYDRHFTICEHFNIEMINIPMLADGPDMDLIEKLVAEDDSIKGIWCVPKYQNPTGITFSDEVVTRMAKMPTKAKDFKILWDNAYVVHHLGDKIDNLKNIHQACVNFGNDNRVFEFCSTSKVTFAGAGVSAIASSVVNNAWLKKHYSYQAIGYDKLNQLRHIKFLKNKAGLLEHMQKQSNILTPKFNAVIEKLEKAFSKNELASWTVPKGGYFISLDTQKGLARKVVKMMDDLGVKLTPAGATYPYNKDPADRNIRIAPSMPVVADIEKASDVLVAVIEYITLGASVSD